MKNWIITGKGFVNCGVDNPYNLNLEITDFVSKLIKDESSFKFIDYFEKDSEEHQDYMFGSNRMFKRN